MRSRTRPLETVQRDGAKLMRRFDFDRLLSAGTSRLKESGPDDQWQIEKHRHDVTSNKLRCDVNTGPMAGVPAITPSCFAREPSPKPHCAPGLLGSIGAKQPTQSKSGQTQGAMGRPARLSH
jgi:hypothetical protein